MSSVTSRIGQIKQPRGGYLKLSDFETITFDDDRTLSENENINASLVGMAVDYLTRFMMGANKEDAFRISLMGAEIAEIDNKGTLNIAKSLLNDIKGLDSQSIINACKLVTFDIWFRNIMAALMGTKGVGDINPDSKTISNIQILVERSLKFLEAYGPITKNGFTFEPNGYTETVNSGDGDFLTEDTLWDFKVSKYKPKPKDRLQILMYWIMGQHSGQEIYNNIYKIGIFNPRLNCIFLLDVNTIDHEIIRDIEDKVICY